MLSDSFYRLLTELLFSANTCENGWEREKKKGKKVMVGEVRWGGWKMRRSTLLVNKIEGRTDSATVINFVRVSVPYPVSTLVWGGEAGVGLTARSWKKNEKDSLKGEKAPKGKADAIRTRNVACSIKLCVGVRLLARVLASLYVHQHTIQLIVTRALLECLLWNSALLLLKK